MINNKALWLAGVLAMTITGPAWADLQIATSKVEITGPIGYPMGGYGARKGVSQGVHDPLLAKVLLIKSNGKQFGVVTLDVVVFLSPKVAREARENLGIDPLLQIETRLRPR